MKFELLNANKAYLPIIANWYLTEWGNPHERDAIENEVVKLQEYLNEDKVPLMLTVSENNTLIGVSQIKEYEMSIYPHYKYWLGGVYVSKNHRNKGVAKSIILSAIDKARKLNIEKLYLQTEDLTGGLYAKLGWNPIEEVKYNGVMVVVMEKAISIRP